MEVCSKCKIEKDKTEFDIRSNRPNDQLRSWCKSCYRVHYREYRKKNRSKFRENERSEHGKALRTKYRLSAKGKLSSQQYVRRRRERKKELDLKLQINNLKIILK